MPTVHVYGNRPDSGPKYLSAKTSCDEINDTNPTWGVVFHWTAEESTFTSATAATAALESAVKKELPHYLYNTTP